MRIFCDPLKECKEIEDLEKKLSGKDPKGFYQVSGAIDAAKGHLIHGVGRGKHRLVLTFSERKARELYEDLCFFEEECFLYPARDLLFYQAALQGNLEGEKRMHSLRALSEKKEVCIVTTFSALFGKIPGRDSLLGEVLVLKEGEEADLSALAENLVKMGYYRSEEVSAPGDFALRGGILDIFPLTAEDPVRLEFFDDTIDSVRTFDLLSQRSVENLPEVSIFPSESAKTDEEGTSLLSWFLPEGSLVFLDEPDRTFEHGRAVELEFSESMKMRLESGEVSAEELPELIPYEKLLYELGKYPCIGLSALEKRSKELEGEWIGDMSIRSVSSYHNSFELLVTDLKRYRKEGYRIILLSASRTHALRLPEDLAEHEITSYYTEDTDRSLLPGEVAVLCGNIAKSFEYPLLGFVVISWNDFTGATRKKKRKTPRYEGEKIADFTELSVGDYVIHERHGLGIFRGIEKVEMEKTMRDYIKIEYADHGNLYIPATQMNLIQKYAGKDAKAVPRLNRLGGKEWSRTKERVKNAVRIIAKELVELYSIRQSRKGHAFREDTVWQREFEELFPYEETEDQRTAIEDTKRDMESEHIMDRLICGDVGYGKTEVALRAAFKAVQEGKQVALLVPTTILGQQHYNTFSQRMKEYPVRIDLLSRFRTASEQKKTLTDLKKGQVDILIGTHRLLSKDVVFHDLGLLIVDEEQRFGVTHKEKIKQMKKDVDVLTLTATPIPRTLHMSLIGIRDMSVLNEPPQDRVPIQTYVMEYSLEMVREAISREISRNGQVYYVFNRVNGIRELTDKLRALLPEAEIAYAHGQMKETELEDIMYRFINGEIEVLVTTTIIETGLDIANVNTMIIHDADRFGLSQLYQLRGRIGRSSRTAYAFLMFRKDKLLPEAAEKRLAAIREFTDLGSGFKIAMRDLEIRGAGNLLGAEQHGHMEAVGYDLYCKLLNEAVKTEKGEKEEPSFDTVMDLSVDAYIPASYISNELHRMDIYKRIAGIESREEAMEMTDELIDRFGSPPKGVLNLIDVAVLRARAHSLWFTEVTEKGEEIRFVFYEQAGIDPAGLPPLLTHYQGALSFRRDEETPYLLYSPRNTREKQKDTMAFLVDFFEKAEYYLLQEGRFGAFT